MEGDCTTIDQWPAIIDKAVVVVEALEDLGVDEACRAEPATGEVNVRDVAPTDAHVHDINSVGWNATWEWGCRTLVYHYIRFTAFVTPYSVWFHHCSITMKKFAMWSNRDRVLGPSGFVARPTTKTCEKSN